MLGREEWDTRKAEGSKNGGGEGRRGRVQTIGDTETRGGLTRGRLEMREELKLGRLWILSKSKLTRGYRRGELMLRRLGTWGRVEVGKSLDAKRAEVDKSVCRREGSMLGRMGYREI